MSLGTDEFASVMQGIGLNVFPMCVISLQAILTLQLVCMNPVIVVFLYEAVMIVPLSMRINIGLWTLCFYTEQEY